MAKKSTQVQFTENPAGKLAEKISRPIRNFLAMESSSGILLLVTTALALIIANSAWGPAYFHLLHVPFTIAFGEFAKTSTLHHVVNDGLMVLFFYVVGLEIKRELFFGRLSNPRTASFTVFAAIGGMIVPAIVYYLFNNHSPGEPGWGIPMATDIAFAVGVMALLGNRVPLALKVFLLAFAIVDDLGAVMVIAFFYTQELYPQYLGFAGGALFLLFLLSYAGVRHIVVGITLGLFVWFCFLQSGVHATIAGVILAFLTPSGQVPAITPKQIKESNDSSALERWETALHPWVSYLIMPIFAFFNAGVELKGITVADLLQNTVSLGILSGLIFGKPIGIFLSSFIAVKAKLAYLPDGVSWNHILGAGFLGGVGFTMSLFINNLAFSTSGIDTYSKSAILLASAVAGFAGYVSLLLITKPSKPNQ